MSYNSRTYPNPHPSSRTSHYAVPPIVQNAEVVPNHPPYPTPSYPVVSNHMMPPHPPPYYSVPQEYLSGYSSLADWSGGDSRAAAHPYATRPPVHPGGLTMAPRSTVPMESWPTAPPFPAGHISPQPPRSGSRTENILLAYYAKTKRPNMEEMRALAKETGKTEMYVIKWFINKRVEDPEYQDDGRRPSARPTVFTDEQLRRLREEFDRDRSLKQDRRVALAEELGIGERTIIYWFAKETKARKKALHT